MQTLTEHTAYSIDKVLLVLTDNRVRGVIWIGNNDGGEALNGQRQRKEGKYEEGEELHDDIGDGDGDGDGNG